MMLSPTHQMGTIFCVDATELGNNPAWFTLETDERMQEYNDLFMASKAAVDDTERAEALKELQILEREMILANWLCLQRAAYAVNSDLRGYSLSAAGTYFKDCYFVEQ